MNHFTEDDIYSLWETLDTDKNRLADELVDYDTSTKVYNYLHDKAQYSENRVDFSIYHYLTNIMFNVQLDAIPLYINEPKHLPFEEDEMPTGFLEAVNIIIKWRLKIGK